MTSAVADGARGFHLVLESEGADSYGLRLHETTVSSGRPGSPVAEAGARATRRVISSVLAALRDSRLPGSALASSRRKPLVLDESAGVRLSLVLLASRSLSKPERVEAVEAGVAAMSTEEAYYWYAKCTGPDRMRARRALRLLLAED